MAHQEYTEEFKLEKINELREQREKRSKGEPYIQLSRKYGKNMINLISSWERADRRGERIYKEYPCVCRNCNKNFMHQNKRKVYCSKECKEEYEKNDNAPKDTSICFECINYWACGKKDKPLEVQKRMKKYEFVWFNKYQDIKNAGKVLKVYKCDGFIQGSTDKQKLSKKVLDMKYQAMLDKKPIFFKREWKK